MPQGYLRVLVFDKDSALVSQHTRQLTARSYQQYDSLRVRVVVPQDGYVTAYVGTQSNVDVYFDNVSVELRQGIQVQETQYDPTGLELAGLVAPSPGIRGLNRYQWNGKEFQPDLGLNWTQLDWRMVDTQRGGGFHVVDPEIENGQESMSPYAFGFDNAVRFNDPNGRKGEDLIVKGTTDFKTKAFNDWQKLSSSKLLLLKDGHVVESSSYKGEKKNIESTGVVPGEKSLAKGTEIVRQLIQSDKTNITRQSPDGTNYTTLNDNNAGTGAMPNKTAVGTGTTISYNPDLQQGPLNTDGTSDRPAYIGLGHEGVHATHANAGIVNLKMTPLLDPDSKMAGVLSQEEVKTRTQDNSIRYEQKVPERAVPCDPR